MNALGLPSSDPNYKRSFQISVALHALIVGSFFIKYLFIDSDRIDFQSAVRVDLVGLPDKLTQKDLAPPAGSKAEPLPPEAKPPAPVKDAAKTESLEASPKSVALPDKKELDDSLSLKKAKAQQQAALDRLKSMSSIDKIKKQLESEKKKAAGNENSSGKNIQVKGNVLSAGTALTGLTQLQHDNYVSNLDSHIKNNWTLPQWLANKDYKAQVLLKLDAQGLIVSREIVKSSGNPNYDDVVISTIDRSAPYPAPPEKFIRIVEVRGILIGFPE
jgi:colicin import membrane protein